MDRFEVPRGTRDFLPDEMVVRNHVERVVRETFESFGFQHIQTPTFESFDLFAARSGEEIRESMFTFASDAGRYALRPELTAPVCRLVASGNLNTPLPHKLYYSGSCFRYCKPQEGRYREFFQVGTELIGAPDELADAEVIALAAKVLRRLEIPGFRLKIGNVGVFQHLLKQQDGEHGRLRQDWELDVLHDIDRLMHTAELCQAIVQRAELRPEDIAFVKSERKFLYHTQNDIDYQGDFEIKPDDDVTPERIRQHAEALPKAAEDTCLQGWSSELSLPVETGRLLLDVSHLRGGSSCVIPKAKELLANTSAIDSLDNLARVADRLDAFGVTEYEVVLGTVRNLDFYTGTVFEIDSDLLGAQKQVCGGGRYDKLVEEFGGNPIPATGFAFGFDRLVKIFKEAKNDERLSRSSVDVMVICEEDLRLHGIEVAELLRDAGLRVAVDLCSRGVDRQKEYAEKLKATYSVILEGETADGTTLKLREKTNSGLKETELSLSALSAEIKQRMNPEKK